MSNWDFVLLWAAMILLGGSLLFLALYVGFEIWALMSFAPFVSSGRRKFELMLELAQIRSGQRVVELGSGDGELCVMAAERGAIATGIEINPFLVWRAQHRAARVKVVGRCRFIRQNLWSYPLPRDTETVFLYGMPYSMEKVWLKLKQELKPGTKVVSHGFTFPGRKPEETVEGVRLYEL